MIDQLPLPFTNHAYLPAEPTDTQLDAYRRVFGSSGDTRRRVFDALMAVPSTDAELQSLLQLDGNTERPRRLELLQAKLIEDSGERRQRCIVWRVCEHG